MNRLCFLVASIAALGAHAITVSNLRVSPNDIAAGDAVQIMFKLDQPAALDVSLCTLNGTLVTTIVRNAQYPAGQFSMAYRTGRDMPGGLYRPVVTARAGGQSVTASLLSQTARTMPLNASVTSAPDGGKTVAFAIDEPMLVAVRAGIINGPLYHVIADWQLFDPGAHVIAWDGWDADHVVRASVLTNISIDVRGMPVSVNALRVRNTRVPAPAETVQAPALLANTVAFTPQFALTVPRKTFSRGARAAGDTADIRIDVAGETIQRFKGIPYEYVLYVDVSRYGELENVSSPYTWNVSIKNLGPGDHVFTLMVSSAIEQVGSRSFKVHID